MSESVSLFEPDYVLPEQFFAAFAGQERLGSERRLMLAVLQDAVECYQKYALSRTPTGRVEFDDARQWIESTDRDWSFSFENICDTLGLNAVYLRRGILKFGSGRRAVKRRAPRIVALAPTPVFSPDAGDLGEAFKQAS